MRSLPLDPAAWLAAIVESSDDAIVSKTVDGVITSWNAGAQRLYGYTADEALGKSILLIVPDDRQQEEQHILRLIASGERVDHFETERRAKDGRCIPVSLTISPVRDSNGVIVGASKIARDITERRANEQALHLANQRKDEFLAMLGHELRNPLAPIQSAVDILQREVQTQPALAELCGVLKRQVQHMVRLLDDLLDLGRISSGKIQMRMERTDLRSVVWRAVETARPAIDERAHMLNVSVPGAAVWVSGDTTRLIQMLANLLHNAAKYTPPGGTLSAAVSAVDGEARLTVSDNGVGIAPHLLLDVFELFVQCESTLDRSQGGLGIGLTLVRNIAALHGGRVVAHSEGEGCGSTFSVHLPLLATAPLDGDCATHPSPGSSPSPARRVVVLDDNADAAVMLAVMLRKMGHEAEVMTEAQIGLARILQSTPDVAFVDIGLPVMTGHAVARALRDAGYRGLLVAITGYGQPDDVERSRVAGFDHHCVKPVDQDRIESLMAGLPAQ